ncbi:MAG: potassium channel family protein [Methanosphaera sp.]
MKLRSYEFKISDDTRLLLSELKDILLVLLTLIDFLFIFIITFFNVSVDVLYFMSIFDLMVCFLLFLNLVSIYLNSTKSLWEFIKTHIIDIISIIPFNFIFLRYFAVFRVIRLLRLLQVVQLTKVVNFRNIHLGALKYFIQNRLLKVLTVIIVFYVILSSVILSQIDPAFTSIFDSFWYNIVTLTGVGYGDITPISYPGKVMGIFTIIMGVLFISIFTAAMSALYMEKPEEETRRTMKVYIKQLKGRNRILQNQVDKLDQDISDLHVKLDVITQLLEEHLEKEEIEDALNNVEVESDETRRS